VKLKFDLHVHTEKSSDAFTTQEELASGARRADLSGVAITDHNILATEGPPGITVIPGIEISSRDGHIIALGIPSPVVKGLSADETLRQIRALGGLSIIAHPYDLFRSAIRPDRLGVMPDAIEVVNSASIGHSFTWKKAKAFADKRMLPQTAGSDSHIPETIGKAFTTIESESTNVSAILDAIRKGFTVPSGRPYTFRDRLSKLSRRKGR
jgi:predicted metal-dependent phosphoesterase TrpH